MKFRSYNKELDQFFYFFDGNYYLDEKLKSCILKICEEFSWENAQQFIGLVDKNEKDIYVGDILNSKNDGSDGCDIWDYYDHENITVTWDDTWCCFMGMPEVEDDNTSVYNISRIEVIGNIDQSFKLSKKEEICKGFFSSGTSCRKCKKCIDDILLTHSALSEEEIKNICLKVS